MPIIILGFKVGHDGQLPRETDISSTKEPTAVTFPKRSALNKAEPRRLDACSVDNNRVNREDREDNGVVLSRDRAEFVPGAQVRGWARFFH